MRIFAACCLILVLLTPACHSEKGQEPMTPSRVKTFGDFLKLFPEIHLPYHLGADTLDLRTPDSLSLPPDLVARFFPDTLLRGISRHRDGMKFFPIGATSDSRLRYLLIRVGDRSQKDGILCTFDDKGKFLGRLLAGRVISKTNNILVTTELDKQMDITVSEEQRLGPGKTLLRERVYSANPGGGFSLILVNSNEPLNPQQLYNPIDSLPSAHRFSGDYTAGHMNLVSIRDAKNQSNFRFFIHFSKDRGNCTGEVDGTARWTGSGDGLFKEKSGPCQIRFSFSSGKV
ncbi:MAG TPA: hypothetical protein VMV20_06725, partial [Chitinophagaceae bacterium]|nr:hypothetical protein [Chitinophagaceae bacterium]